MPRQLYVGDIAWRHEQPTPTEIDISAPAIWLGGQRVAAPAIGEDGQTRANPVVDQAPRPAVFFPKDFPSSSINLPGTQPPLKGAYGYSFTRDSFARHFEGQGFTHDADFAFRSCHDAVSLYQIGWRRFVTGYAMGSAANGLSVQQLSERATQTVQILSGGVGRLTEPFYVHGAHSYFCAEGGARSLFGTMNQGAGSILRSLSAPAALEALIAPIAKTAPVDPAAREANPTSGASIGQFGRDRATLANAWLSAAAEAPVASKDGAPAKTSILKTASLNTASALDDGPKIELETLAHPFVCQFSDALARYGVPGLLRSSTQDLKPLLNFAVLPFNAKVVREPYPEDRVDFGEGKLSQAIRSTAFSAYNWELFFHIPTLLADRLLQSNHFEEALRMLRYVFDPTDGEGGYWKFKPFASVSSSVRLENVKSLLASIQKAASDSLKQLAEWRDHPFQPHLLARHRIGEYMKFVVLKMIDICLKAGDYYFRQDTIESIEIARLYYVMAADLLGSRPVKVPASGHSSAKSFAELRAAGLDEFGNALVAFENELPFHNSALTAAIEEGSTVLGMSRSSYFGIPQDETLLAQWDLVEDRLFKIRHSMNIDGITRQLPLFEPPIDPMLLVQAAARGVDINSVINDLTAPMPAYRFGYMLQRALEMCSEVKGLGSSLLSAIEKKDGEHLALLRSSHEIDMLRLIREVKAQQVDELEKQRLVNQTLLDSALLGVKHYEQLIAAQLIDQERLHLSYLDEANDWQGKAGVADTLASYLHLFPQIAIKPAPPPVPEISVGGMQLGTYMNTVARFFSFMGGQASYQANVKSISGGHARREQEWKFMLDRARLEKTQQERQLVALDIRIAIANLELSNHDKQIEHATEIDDFLRRQKFSNQELYAWMESKISEVYYQSYQLAYELAKKAERAYRFELGVTNSDFIKFGSWDSQRKGLMAGEQLALQLRQMERAYHEANKREYEITKHVSLLSLDPMALIRLKEEGAAQFALPEALFDMDFPGHYMRRIKSVSITLPCVTGPYASVSATLRLMKSRIRYKPETAIGYAPREDDTRFLTNYASTRAVATSTGQNDAGLFELNFRDERYLPFEGEGVESLWQLEINKDYAGFDIHTLSDAVLHIRYTAREGGEKLKSAAKTHLSEALKSTFTTLDGKPQPLTRLFSVRHEFPEAWNELTLPVPADATGEVTRVLTLPITKERFPFFTLGRKVMPTRVKVLIAPKPDAKVPDFKVAVQDKPLSDAGTSSEPTAASVVHREWSAEGPFAQVAQDEGNEWKLSLTLDAIAMQSAVQRLEELVISIEYKASI